MIEVILAVMFMSLLGLAVNRVIGPLLDEMLDVAIERAYEFIISCDFIQVAGFLSGSS